MKYADATDYLYSDGSLRDVYALDLGLEELERFFAFVRPRLKEYSFTVDGEAAQLPKTYKEIVNRTEKAACLLRIPVGHAELNCHFFTDKELELDLSPEDYDSEKDWGALQAFLSDLANAMKKELILTPENTPEEVYVRFQPTAEQDSDGNAEKPPGAEREP